MRIHTVPALVSLLLAAAVAGPATARAQDVPESPADAVARLLAAQTADERRALADALVVRKADPEAVAAALAAGRRYAKDVPTGWLERTIVAPDGKERPYLLHVPKDYDPARRYRMVVDMHGGVSRPKTLTHAELGEMKFFWGAEAEANGWILALPAGEAGCVWWDAVGSGMVLGILRETRRTWNVDEDAVFATGFSDGASGSWYLAAAQPTPFAGFIPLNGHPSVAGMGGVQIHLRNYVNTPVYAINTDLDSLYPSSSLKPIVAALTGLGAPLVWREVLGFRHDPTYLPAERPAILKWMDGVRRTPDPKVVWWEGAAGAPSRVRWLRVTQVTGGSGAPPFEDVNPVLSDDRVRIGVNVDQEFAGPGVRISGVVPDSIATGMGLQAGDVLVGIDGADLADFAALRRALARKKPGDDLAVRFRRGEESVEKSAKIPPARSEPAFDRSKPHGTIRAEAKGNRIEVACAGIGSFELLLSPRLVDLSKPVEVVVNGAPAFAGTVAPDVGFMLSQHLEDEDRALVYRARLPVTVPAPPPAPPAPK